MTTSENLAAQFATAVTEADGTPLQICLPFTGPIGPGVVKRSDRDGIYTIETQAQMGHGGAVIVMDLTFDAAMLIWYAKGPRKQERPLVVPMSGGGLVVPRG